MRYTRRCIAVAPCGHGDTDNSSITAVRAVPLEGLDVVYEGIEDVPAETFERKDISGQTVGKRFDG